MLSHTSLSNTYKKAQVERLRLMSVLVTFLALLLGLAIFSHSASNRNHTQSQL